MKITLGQKYKDNVTGFEGTAIARIEYVWGCIQYELKPAVDKDGKLIDGAWFDETRLVDASGAAAEPEAARGVPSPSSVPTFSHP